MSEESTTLYILAAVCVVAVVGLALSVASFVTNDSVTGMMGGGGGMMGGGGTGTASHPGLLEWAILALSVTFLAIAAVLAVRGRAPRSYATPPAAMGVAVVPTTPPGPGAALAPSPSVSVASAASTPVPEPTLVKLLNEDERRMYLEIRDHGGAMLQRDLVALGMFSKAKVTRVLDKLEAKGVVVREAHGMTNRVRLTNGAAR